MRNTTLKTLKDDMIDHIKSSRDPYTSDIAEIKRGIHGYTDIVNKPFIGISMESDKVDQEIFASSGTDQIRRMRIYIYCFMEKSFDNYTELYQLIDDVEYFMKYDFTYKDNTYIKDINVMEGGVSATVSFFDMYIEIQYQSNI